MSEMSPKARYHHGDLRTALIDAAESILMEKGVEGLSLREAARRAGVSPGAPAHHFGDAGGLLTTIAMRGFAGLDAALGAADEASMGQPPRDRLKAQGQAYVAFARAQPAWFDLMWRCDLIDMGRADFQLAAHAAFTKLEVAVLGTESVLVDPHPAAEGGKPMHPRVLAAWALVHGYATLARQGSFDPDQPGLLEGVLESLPPVG